MILLSYFMVYFVLGSTYFFIRQAVQTIPPLYVLAFRFLVGGFLLLLLARLRGRIRPLPTHRQILSALIVGTFLFLIGVGLVTKAQQYVYSYLTSLLVGSVPLIVVFFDYFLIKKAITPMRLLGVMVGLSGMAFLLYDGRSLATSFSPAVVMILAGIVSWSLATSISHTLPVYPNNFVHSSMQMLYVGGVCLAAALIVEPPLAVVVPAVSPRSFFSLLYLAFVGALAFSAYVYLIQNEPAQRVATYAFVNPMVALGLGFLFGQEKAVPYLAVGLPLSLLGLLLNFYGDRWLARLLAGAGRAQRE